MNPTKKQIDYYTIKAVESLIDMPNTLERIVRDNCFIALIKTDETGKVLTLVDFTKKMTYDPVKYVQYCQELYDDFANPCVYYNC